MLPLVDIHCHLLAGLDDGPADWHEAIAMCRIAWEDGTRAIAATAHQNYHWPEVTPARILHATSELAKRLKEARIPLIVYPAAEAMISPDFEAAFMDGQLLTISNLKRYLLIELPHGVFLDLRNLVTRLMELGTQPILVHPERHPELLHGNGEIEELILRGCLVQVNSESITQKMHPKASAAVRSWAQRGVIHLIASDGHATDRRTPGISAAYSRMAEWTDWATADRICSTNGMAVLEGLPVDAPHPRAKKRRWFARVQ